MSAVSLGQLVKTLIMGPPRQPHGFMHQACQAVPGRALPYKAVSAAQVLLFLALALSFAAAILGISEISECLPIQEVAGICSGAGLRPTVSGKPVKPVASISASIRHGSLEGLGSGRFLRRITQLRLQPWLVVRIKYRPEAGGSRTPSSRLQETSDGSSLTISN